MGKNQHVLPKGDMWEVQGEGNKKATRVVKTQEEAIRIATTIAKNQKSEMLIHGENGRIRERNSYGSDPKGSKG